MGSTADNPPSLDPGGNKINSWGTLCRVRIGDGKTPSCLHGTA